MDKKIFNITATFTGDDGKVLATYNQYNVNGIDNVADTKTAISDLSDFIITEIDQN